VSTWKRGSSRQISFPFWNLPQLTGAGFNQTKIGLARRRLPSSAMGFGSADSIPTRAALGQKLVFDGRAYEVVGVAPPGFQLSGAADVYTPIGQSTDPRLQNRGARFLRVLGV